MLSTRNDPDQPVPLVLAPNDFEAQVITQALNAEGILAAVMGSHSQWLGSGNPLSSVNVMVRRAQRMEALGVLRRIRAEAKEMPIPEGVPERAIDEQGRCIVCSYDMTGLNHTLVCPECGANLAEDSMLFSARADGSVMNPAVVRIVVLVLLFGAILAGIVGVGRSLLF